MKLFTKSEITKTRDHLKLASLEQGLSYATLVDKEIKKLNSLRDEYETEKQRITQEYTKLFKNYEKLLSEVQQLEKRKLDLEKS